MKRIIFLLVIIVLFTGCYDYHELNNMNIVNSIAIDYDNDYYTVYFEVIKSTKKDDFNEYEKDILKGQDKNIAKAFKNAIDSSEKEVYLKQSRLLILSDELCKNGINNVISYLLNDNTLSNNYFLVITNDIMKIFDSDNKQMFSNNVISIMKNSSDREKIDDIEKIAGDLMNHNKDIALPYVEIDDERININKIGYFNDDYLVNYIDNKIYNFLIKDINNIEFSFNNNMISIYDKKIKYDIKEDKIDINISGYGYANLISNDYDLKNKDSYNDLENTLNIKIKDEVMDFFDITINDTSDLVSLNDLYYKKYHKIINDLKYEVNVDIKIDKNGSLYEGLHD